MIEVDERTVLIVDDSKTNLKLIENYLKSEYIIYTAETGQRCFEIVEETPPDLILLDILLPDINGFKICRELKSHPLTKQIPIIFISGEDGIKSKKKGFEAGGVDYITKPFSVEEIKARVNTHVSLKKTRENLEGYNLELERLIDKKTAALRKALYSAEEFAIETIFRLSRAAEHKDLTTAQHIERVSYYSALIGQESGFSGLEIETIIKAAPMHDIGKIGTPDSILQKPGPLTPAERKEMQTHTTVGSKILEGSNSPTIQMAQTIALHHHEKWDGTGYPFGLKGTEIPLAARIVAVADVFDALVSKRPYKEAFPIERALDIIKKDSGTHFDPELVELFFEHLPRVKEIMQEYND